LRHAVRSNGRQERNGNRTNKKQALLRTERPTTSHIPTEN